MRGWSERERGRGEINLSATQGFNTVCVCVCVFLSQPWSPKMSTQEWRATRTQTKKVKKRVFNRSSSVSVIGCTSYSRQQKCVCMCVLGGYLCRWTAWRTQRTPRRREGRRWASLNHFCLIYDLRAAAALHAPSHQRSHPLHAVKALCNGPRWRDHAFAFSWLG